MPVEIIKLKEEQDTNHANNEDAKQDVPNEDNSNKNVSQWNAVTQYQERNKVASLKQECEDKVA